MFVYINLPIILELLESSRCIQFISMGTFASDIKFSRYMTRNIYKMNHSVVDPRRICEHSDIGSNPSCAASCLCNFGLVTWASLSLSVLIYEMSFVRL